MSKDKVSHPPWSSPNPIIPTLSVLNSLTSSKVPFYPSSGNKPTVYDSAHLGHARAYVTFDIIRRIMNIDDKIILRARRNFLYKEYSENVKNNSINVDTLLNNITSAFQLSKSKINEKLAGFKCKGDEDSTKQAELETKKLTSQDDAEAVVLSLIKSGDFNAAVNIAKDVLPEYLDLNKGDRVFDQGVFDAHARMYEAEFLEDMHLLGVQDPDTLTRVSEFVPQVITFVEKLIKNGKAYESNGSVYFSVPAFTATNPYGKLAPWSVSDLSLLAEGEGALCGGKMEKQHPSDFCLWKASKIGEPRWDSPWGEGRPGWHIECSAMAGDLLGEKLDIHAGGEDLRFPHHDNEIAQSEAHFECKQWVNYFFHAGHLHIEGLKMSKSLKNFITIRDVLVKYTSRQIRLFFLATSWHSKMNFSNSGLDEAQAKDKNLKEFLLTCKAVLRTANISKSDQAWNQNDRTLHDSYTKKVELIHLSLLDNFDTPTAVSNLFEMIKETNKYMSEGPKSLLVQKIFNYVQRMFTIFGVLSQNDDETGVNKETVIAPVVDSLMSFRNSVRDLARSKGVHELLSLCDTLRDDALPDLGIRLEDGANSTWKLDDPAILKREREEKKKAAKDEKIKSAQNKLNAREAELEKIRDALIPAANMFKVQTDKYSTFDENGLPLLDHEGKEVSKKQKSNNEKLQKKQEELNKKYKPEDVTEKVSEVEKMRVALDALTIENDEKSDSK